MYFFVITVLVTITSYWSEYLVCCNYDVILWLYAIGWWRILFVTPSCPANSTRLQQDTQQLAVHMPVNCYITEPNGALHQVTVRRNALGRDCFDSVGHAAHQFQQLISSITVYISIFVYQGMQAASSCREAILRTTFHIKARSVDVA